MTPSSQVSSLLLSCLLSDSQCTPSILESGIASPPAVPRSPFLPARKRKSERRACSFQLKGVKLYLLLLIFHKLILSPETNHLSTLSYQGDWDMASLVADLLCPRNLLSILVLLFFFSYHCWHCEIVRAITERAQLCCLLGKGEN